MCCPFINILYPPRQYLALSIIYKKVISLPTCLTLIFSFSRTPPSYVPFQLFLIHALVWTSLYECKSKVRYKQPIYRFSLCWIQLNSFLCRESGNIFPFPLLLCKVNLAFLQIPCSTPRESKWKGPQINWCIDLFFFRPPAPSVFIPEYVLCTCRW